MKKSRSLLTTQRRSVDEKLKSLSNLRDFKRPKGGWIRTIRESLAMSAAQLAAKIGIQQSGVSLLEKREMQKKVSLETLEKAAEAMNCELVYVLIPKQGSLEKIFDLQARNSARKILRRTSHSMNLENQAVGHAESDLHFEELVTELKTKGSRKIWSPE